MTADIVNVLAGLIVGMLSGWFFERRATTAAKAHSQELERELAQIRCSVLTVGGSMSLPSQVAASATSGDLLGLVRGRALSTQDSEGRVIKSSLTTYFLARGNSTQAIDTAVCELCTSGQAKEVGKWLILR